MVLNTWIKMEFNFRTQEGMKEWMEKVAEKEGFETFDDFLESLIADCQSDDPVERKIAKCLAIAKYVAKHYGNPNT